MPSLEDAVPVGYFFKNENKSVEKVSSQAAITERSFGKGKAFYFSFDVPKTIWLLHQGRPVWEDMDGDGWLRTLDMTLLSNNSVEVMYSDELKFLMWKMIAHNPIPFIREIPPINGKIADSFFHWAGDDEGSTKIQVDASNFLRSKGLPYQINAMPINGKFPMSDEEVQQVIENNHVFSLNYNFIDGFKPGDGFLRSDLIKQFEAFKKRFKKTLYVQ